MLQILDDTFGCGFFVKDGRSTDTYSTKGTFFLLRKYGSHHNDSFCNFNQSLPHPQKIDRPAPENLDYRSNLCGL